MAQSYTQGATAYLTIGGFMRKVEFAIQLTLVMMAIYGAMGLGGIIMATRAQASAGQDLANTYGNLDPAVVTPPTRDDYQDPKPAQTDPQIENHGAKMPKGAILKTDTVNNSFYLN